MSDEKKKRGKGHIPAPDDLEHRPSGTPAKPASDGRYYCQAKKKDGTICKNYRVNPDNKRCKHHGGMSTGRTSGSQLRSTKPLHRELFTDDEVAYLEELKNDDMVKHYDDEIDIARVRLRRMMLKIQSYKEQQWREIEKKETIGQNGNMMISQTETTSQSTDQIIQRIEQDVTKVQNQIMKLLNSKAQYLATINQDTQVDISVFVNAVKQNTQNLWEDEENEQDIDGEGDENEHNEEDES